MTLSCLSSLKVKSLIHQSLIFFCPSSIVSYFRSPKNSGLILTSVTLPRVRSWKTTTWLSRVRCTSISAKSEQCKAAITAYLVFSGKIEDKPLWAIILCALIGWAIGSANIYLSKVFMKNLILFYFKTR